MIRSSFDDLPSFSRDAVQLISTVAADRIKEVLEAALQDDGMWNSGEVREINSTMLKKAIEGDMAKNAHLVDVANGVKPESKRKNKKAKKGPKDSPSAPPASTTSNSIVSEAVEPHPLQPLSAPVVEQVDSGEQGDLLNNLDPEDIARWNGEGIDGQKLVPDTENYDGV